MSISFFNRMGHNYLMSRPYVYNGGLVGKLLTNIYVTNSTTNFNINMNSSLNLSNYIGHFFFSSVTAVPLFNNHTVTFDTNLSNNLPSSIFGVIYLIISITSCIVAGLLWIGYRECKYKAFCHWCSKKIKKLNASKESRTLHFTTKRKLHEEEKKTLNYHLILCSLSQLFTLLSVIFFVFSVSSQINLELKTFNQKTNDSLATTWVQLTGYMNNFFNVVTNQSFVLLNQTINNLSISLNNVFMASLSNLTSSLLQYFGVTSVFKSASDIIGNLSQTIQSMQYIASNANAVTADINSQTGFLAATITSLANIMSRVCASTSTNTACLKYLNDSNTFRVVIDTSLISQSSSVTMLFLVNQSMLNISAIKSQFTTMQTNLNLELTGQSNYQINRLNLSHAVAEMSYVFTYISNTVSPWVVSYTSLSTSISSFVNIFGITITISISALLIVIFVLIALSTVAIFRYTKSFYYQRKLLVSLIDSHPSEAKTVMKQNTIIHRRHKFKLHKSIIYGYIVIFGVTKLILIPFSLVLINTSHILYNEACVQIWQPEGVKVTENFLDVFLHKNWKYVIEFLLSKAFPVQLTFSPPTNVLGNFLNKCTNNTGLFNALNVTDFVNISAFLWNRHNLKILKDGVNITYSTLLATNVAEMITADVTSSLQSATTITNYFGNINYQPTIAQLSNGVIQLSNYSSWITSAIQYFCVINSSDASETVRLLQTLNANVGSIQKLEIAVLNLRSHFEIIESSRHSITGIQSLLTNITKVQAALVQSSSTYNAVKAIYGQSMLTRFPVDAEAAVSMSLSYLIGHLFPCDDLSSAFKLLLNNLCVADRRTDDLISLGLNIAVTCAFMMISLHCMWFVIRKEMNDEEKDVSTC